MKTRVHYLFALMVCFALNLSDAQSKYSYDGDNSEKKGPRPSEFSDTATTTASSTLSNMATSQLIISRFLSTLIEIPLISPSTMSESPSIQPSITPVPSEEKSSIPSNEPSGFSEGNQIDEPSASPSKNPTTEPSKETSSIPSNEPSGIPSEQPTSDPSISPSTTPTSEPSMSQNPTNLVTDKTELPTKLPIPPDPAWAGCTSTIGPKPLIRLEKTLVCLSVGPEADWASGVQYLRYSFKPKADEYSRFTIPDSYRTLMANTDYGFLKFSNVTVFTSQQKSISFLRRVYDREHGRVYPHLTAIINVVDGKVDGILWDETCVFCSNDKCLENTLFFNGTEAHLKEPSRGCYKTTRECDDLHRAGGNDCDLTVYFTWTGTDVKGNPLLSSNKRFSMFKTKQLKDSLRDSLPKFPTIKLPKWNKDDEEKE